MTGKARSSKTRTGGIPPGAALGRRPPPRFGGPPGMGRPQMGGRPMMRPRPSVPPANNPVKAQGKSDNDKEMEETFKKLKEMSK